MSEKNKSIGSWLDSQYRRLVAAKRVIVLHGDGTVVCVWRRDLIDLGKHLDDILTFAGLADS
jgi:hypothetical protein